MLLLYPWKGNILPNDAGSNHREHSALMEGTQQYKKQALYGRYEFVQKSAEELDLEGYTNDGVTFGSDKLFNIHKFTVGTNRILFHAGKIEFRAGAQASINFPPESLKSLYGNTPMSGQVYLQIRPQLMMHGMKHNM